MLFSAPVFFFGCLPENDNPPSNPSSNPVLTENFLFKGILNSDNVNNTVYTNEEIEFASKIITPTQPD